MADANCFTKAMFQTLFDYHFWANERILTCAGRLTPEQFAAAEAVSHGSVQALLYHMLRAGLVWTHVLRVHSAPTTVIQAQDYSTVAALAARWQAANAELRVLLDGFDDAAIQQSMEVTRRGEVSTLYVWRILMHMLFHDHQHRTEAAILLTKYGQSPGDLDFILFPG